ncbi:hypothetical protein AGLY_010762 [Aphis glycines]|uniref:Transmembrane protein n=1 Tax=Aphis glycines TaxID=307491 RepID=A0A6G0TEI0_APHGL|nr:hypothetical protein AGLY_010762 [Aphis glycines]
MIFIFDELYRLLINDTILIIMTIQQSTMREKFKIYILFMITKGFLDFQSIICLYNFMQLSITVVCLTFCLNLNFGIFKSLKHKPSFFTTPWKIYPRLTNHFRLESISSRNNAPISNYGGGFRCKIFKKIEKNKKKMTEKRQFLRKTSFRPNRFFLWFVDKKFLDDQKVLKI